MGCGCETSDGRCGHAFRGHEPRLLQDSPGVGKILVCDSVSPAKDAYKDMRHYSRDDLKALQPNQLRSLEKTLRKNSFKWSVGRYFKQATNGEALSSVQIDVDTFHITATTSKSESVRQPVFLISIPDDPSQSWSFVGIHDASEEVEMVEPKTPEMSSSDLLAISNSLAVRSHRRAPAKQTT